MKPNTHLIWGYISEVILASLTYIFIILVFGKDKTLEIISKEANNFATYFSSIMLAATLAFLWTIYSKSDSPFFIWLHKKGAFKKYLTAYSITAIIYGLLTFTLIASNKTEIDLLKKSTLWLLIYGIINFITLINNIHTQLSLNMEFNRVNEKK